MTDITPKTRPSFTVITKPAEGCSEPGRFDANHIAVVMNPGRKTAADPVYALAFECSGAPEVFPADQIVGVEFSADGVHHCPFCDNPLAFV